MSDVGVRNLSLGARRSFDRKWHVEDCPHYRREQTMVGVGNSRLKGGVSPISVPAPAGEYEPEMRVMLLSVKVSSRLSNLRPHCPQNVVSSGVSD